MRFLVALIIVLNITCSCSSTNLKYRKISSENQENSFFIPDNVGAYKKFFFKFLQGGETFEAYYVSPDEFENFKEGAILYEDENLNQIKKTSKTKHYHVSFEGVKVPFLFFLKDQIPKGRKYSSEHEGYLPKQYDPENIVRHTKLPADIFLREVPNLNILKKGNGLIHIPVDQFAKLPLGIKMYFLFDQEEYFDEEVRKLVFEKPRLKETFLGINQIRVSRNSPGGTGSIDYNESNWGLHYSQLPVEHFDKNGYYFPPRSFDFDLVTEVDSRFLFSTRYSLVDEMGQRIFFISKSDYKLAPKGTVFYTADGTKFVKGVDTPPPYSDSPKGFRKFGFPEQMIKPNQIVNDGKSLFDKYKKAKLEAEADKKEVKNRIIVDSNSRDYFELSSGQEQDFFLHPEKAKVKDLKNSLMDTFSRSLMKMFNEKDFNGFVYKAEAILDILLSKARVIIEPNDDFILYLSSPAADEFLSRVKRKEFLIKLNEYIKKYYQKIDPENSDLSISRLERFVAILDLKNNEKHQPQSKEEIKKITAHEVISGIKRDTGDCSRMLNDIMKKR